MIYTVGELFSGVGGITLAFQKAKGFEIKWVNDNDIKACETYRLNFPTHTVYEDDVKKLNPEELEHVDIITAGFPCQSFSVAGYQQGFKDPRGELFFDVARFIDVLKPKAYLLENVRNLVTHDKGKTFDIIKATLVEGLGYSFIPFVLSAHEYGNIPQNRYRVYIVGFRDEAYTEDTKNCTAKFKVPKKLELKKEIADCIENKKHPDKYYFSEDHKYMPELKKTMARKDTLYQWRRVYVRENKQNLCPTLTANMGSGGHNVPLVVDDWGFRKLTPRECFNFQGFPKNYKLPANTANSHLYKQAGNSVAVPVVKRIADSIKKSLK